jgi:hypothetical protein
MQISKRTQTGKLVTLTRSSSGLSFARTNLRLSGSKKTIRMTRYSKEIQECEQQLLVLVQLCKEICVQRTLPTLNHKGSILGIAAQHSKKKNRNNARGVTMLKSLPKKFQTHWASVVASALSESMILGLRSNNASLCSGTSFTTMNSI